MNKSLIVLVISALFASCNSGSGDMAGLKKENDSLKNVIAGMNGGMGSHLMPMTQGINDTNLIDTGTAGSMISNWSTHISNDSNETGFSNSRAFVVNIGDLDTAENHFPSISAFVFYLGLNKTTNCLTLMWSPLTGSTGSYTAYYPYNSSNKVSIFDHTEPCPVCGLSNGMSGITNYTAVNKKHQ